MTRKPGKKKPLDDGMKKMLKAVLLVKAAILGMIALGYLLFPFNQANYEANFVYPPGETPGFWTHFKTWDAQHYLFLADQGYQPGQASNAFYPLFPFLIRVFRFLFLGHSFAAGLLLSNLLCLVALAYLYQWVSKKYGSRTAFLACLFLITFPTAFYMSLPYSESLFLALAVAFFYYEGEGKAVPSLACAFLLPLTRPTGILILAPVLMGLFIKEKPGKKTRSQGKILQLLAFVLGFASYLLWMKLSTGDFWTGFKAQGMFLANNSLAHLFHPLDWFISNFILNHYSLMGFGTGLLDRAFFFFYVWALVSAYTTLDKKLFGYMLVLGLFPALLGNLVSFSRFLLVLFPLFIFFAVRFKRNPEYYLLASLSLQAALALAHSLNYWVA